MATSIVKLEFWADSFHEGGWACNGLSKFYKLKSIKYENGFIPIYEFYLNTKTVLEVTILGSYKNWHPIPKVIEDLIDWGKPDLIAYDPKKNKIIFAVEETAAVPTGNQALQRCERIYGSLRFKIPFWYLLGEFGMHIDGGVRRDSIWPTILGIKLSCIQKTPCIVLHYSDAEHPEDYSFGDGVQSLFKALAIEIGIHFDLNTQRDLLPILTDQYRYMINFVGVQWPNMVSFIPDNELLNDSDVPVKIAELVTGLGDLDNRMLDFFNWGTTDTLPSRIYNSIKPGGIIKNDPFVVELEKIVDKKLAYTLSGNAGSRPQNESDVKDWMKQQKNLFKNNTLPDAEFYLDIDDFPKSVTGGIHITTAKNVFYLIDHWLDVQNALSIAFLRLAGLKININKPIFLYISNSLKPGRIFGDPFTGQLSAFSNIFTRNVAGNKTRVSFAYYPHQVHTQLFDAKLNFRKNKGITIMRELLDFAIFHGGVIVDMKTGDIL